MPIDIPYGGWLSPALSSLAGAAPGLPIAAHAPHGAPYHQGLLSLVMLTPSSGGPGQLPWKMLTSTAVSSARI